MSDQQGVVRFYTLARKIPYLIGKIGDFVLPGGPYTLPQVTTAAAIAAIGHYSMPLWAGDMVRIVAWIPVAAVALAVGFAVGKIPLGDRNPLTVISGFFGYIEAPAWGTRGGKPIRIPRTRRIQHRTSTPTTPIPELRQPAPEIPREALPLPELAEDPVPAPEALPAVAPSRHELDEVQQILAASAQRR